jgi:DNA polymerase-3 subunit delta'
MLTAGGGDGPPGIDDCLALQSEIGLRAFAAKGRLGVVPFADALSLPAANSLLKIAEEPPEGGRLLLLAGEDNLPPTIRSRAWIIRFSETDAALPSPPPVTPAEWAAFLERSKRGTADDIAAEAASWSQSLAASGRPDIAASLSNAVYISRKRRMPVSMVQDALWAILWKGAAIGQIFGDLR